MSTNSRSGHRPGPDVLGSWSMEMDREHPLDKEEGGGQQHGGGPEHGSGHTDRPASVSSSPWSGQGRSWAERLRSTLPTSWNKNVLEVILEKDGRGSFL